MNSAGILIRREVEAGAVDDQCLLQFGKQNDASKRRMCGGDEQAVISARMRPPRSCRMNIRQCRSSLATHAMSRPRKSLQIFARIRSFTRRFAGEVWRQDQSNPSGERPRGRVRRRRGNIGETKDGIKCASVWNFSFAPKKARRPLSSLGKVARVFATAPGDLPQIHHVSRARRTLDLLDRHHNSDGIFAETR